MKSLVTGASGFVGPYLVAHCTDAGDDVIALDDSVDLVDRATVHDALAAHRPEVVYHLAAASHVGASWNDATGALRVNVEGTANLLDAARAAGVRRVVVVGSAEEYGRVDSREVPLREDAPLQPLTPYGVSKIAASYLALQAWLGTGLETIRTRSFSHTGAGQTTRFVVPALAARIVEAEQAGGGVAVGSLEPVRDLTDVRDVVRAYRLLAASGRPGEVYNVCSGIGVAIADIAQRLAARAATPVRLETDPALVRPVDVPWLVGDNTKLHAATGWEPQFTLDDTLDAVMAHAREAVRGQGS